MIYFTKLDSIFTTIQSRQALVPRPIADLSRFQKLLLKLGNPHLNIPPAIHVAGTNGKGSVIAFLGSILQQAGYRVHRLTSPHLIHVNERIVLANAAIDDQTLTQLLQEIMTACPETPYTFFECMTAAGFLAFSRHSADFCLLEVGLGGRLDPTNVIRQPLATVITQIGLDHTALLGSTLSKIAAEKAGIFKNNVPAYTYAQAKPVMEVLSKKAAGGLSVAPALDEELNVGLYGQFQRRNAALAIHALKNLPGITLSDETIAQGLQQVQWPGRLQRIDTGALLRSIPQECTLWLDGAHNVDAAEMLAHEFQKHQPGPVDVIFGLSQQKDAREFLGALQKIVRNFYYVPISHPQGDWPAQDIVNISNQLGVTAYTCPGLLDALQRVSLEKPYAAQVLVCGSLMLVGQALALNEQG